MPELIGFMQGRLVPQVEGRIQAFPWQDWRDEFPLAQKAGLRIVEWTLDQERLRENPFMTAAGQAEIRTLGARHGLRVASLTGDCFMQAPFWKTHDVATRASLQADFMAVTQSAAAVGARFVVVPLVDGGSLKSRAEEDDLVGFLQDNAATWLAQGVEIVFESDFPPAELARFVACLDPKVFGINFDMGNSAALGFDPGDEIAAYGHRIRNVHVKDRLRGGTTVPLTTGAVDFLRVFAELARSGYQGAYILQTARAADGDHLAILSRYRDMTADWINTSENHAA